MWLAELITQRGIGNGMSIIIFANVVAAIPAGGTADLRGGRQVKFGVILAVSLVLLVVIVFMEQGQRRIPVTFAKRVVGRRMYGGRSHLHPAEGQPVRRHPDHLRQLAALHPGAAGERHPVDGFRTFVNNHSRRPASSTSLLYGLLIFVFTFFYIVVAFDPHQQADIIRKQGGLHPRHPARPPHRALPGPHPEPHHPAGRMFLRVAVLPSLLMALWHMQGSPSTERRCLSPSAWRSRR